MEFGNDAQAEAAGKLGTQKPGRVLQALLCLRNDLRAAQGGEENLRVPVIVADFHAGQRNHANPRILEFAADQVGQISLDLVRYTPESGRVLCHVLPNGYTGPTAFGAARRECGGGTLQSTRDLDDFVNFELVTDLEVVEILDRKTALEPGFHLAYIVLETLQ